MKRALNIICPPLIGILPCITLIALHQITSLLSFMLMLAVYVGVASGTEVFIEEKLG
ncbi:hypothetical protein [Paenibacillus lautus]|uniref:hypothetical protein n=1 Tax=Paenibacillus lautus TaxID=1401 RepID=UPI001C7D500B|nr:hypothetical protein [Paenibacillus lautus]MBX4152281.1 hypothetical protein [Paenibacillus lautus]